MRSFSPWLVGMGAIASIVFAIPDFALRGDASGDGEPGRAADSRAVSYLRDVRPILSQHCFQCHGPDEAARKGKLRLDLKESAIAERKGRHIIAPGNLDDSLVWERITTDDAEARMPPEGKTQPLTKRQIETLRAWIKQGAKWEEHWSFLAPKKPAIPTVGDREWIRDPLDAFILARLERERLKPEAEATRAAWLRRASFDLTGLPPTPGQIDEFLKDTSAKAYENQVDRLLASPRYGERQAQEWLDLARYADTCGYQNDQPRSIWKWREWVVNAYNANMPFDRFVIEQLAGDLLPNATLAQRVATGFNRNHPTNSEAGEEEDEYRSAYVIDRVNTTATVFMGMTMACVQCHDHKYDPISQRDYYSFYSFFNNIKERDADFRNPRPSIPVPNLDQEPRVADLKARISALQARLDREDTLIDAAQKEWERKTLARLGQPIAWTIARPAAMSSRNGALLKQLTDGSVLSGGIAPVRDTYDVMLLPGKKHIAALRLEVLPDPSQPRGALGRATDGVFNLSAIEIRHTTLSESQDPPLVYLSRAEADINQKVKEDATAFDMFPGSIESAVVFEPINTPDGQFFRGNWSIVGDERMKQHEAVFLPLEPLDTNDASVIRISLHHQGGRKFKSLIGRFRISYTDEDRIRTMLMPAQTKLWNSVGPFPAEDTAKAYGTPFEPEKDIKSEPIDPKKRYTKVVLVNEGKTPAGMGSPKNGSGKDQAGESKQAGDPEKAPPPKAKGQTSPAKPVEKDFKPIPLAIDDNTPPKKKGNKDATKGEKKADAKKDVKPKAEQITWTEQRKWRDGSATTLQGNGAFAYYLTRKIVSTNPRTATVQIDGPVGFKMWLNGELVKASSPPPTVEPPSSLAKKPPVGGGEDEPPPPDLSIFDMSLAREKSRMERKFRIGLRQGENEIVLKVVYGGGQGGGRLSPVIIGVGGPVMASGPGGSGSFLFNLTPEGDDVFTHEVATILRQEALDRARLAVLGTIAGLGLSATETRVPAVGKDKLPALKDGKPRKVSLVGEKSAPLRSDREENKLTPSERREKVLREYYRSHIDPVGSVIAEEIAKLKEEERDLKRQMPETLVMEELEKPRQAYIFLRGLYKNRGENVDPATPAVLPPMSTELPRNRLGLAKWLVSGQHPLTARVVVNRIWQQYFGLGIVRTAEDFGVRGEFPTHPELLDYLATELVDDGWNLKKFHKRIVLSATYRQAAVASKDKLERDPENRLLTRGPRLRQTAEMVRDNALAVSGLLFEKIGGESVKPLQPKDATKGVETFSGTYRRDRGEKQYRRALYVFWQRGAPYPSMLNFDACKRDAVTVTRATTVTPLQALTLLNDPVYVECAKMLGQRMLKDKEATGRARGLKKPEVDAKRLTYGFRLCTSRLPTEKELNVLRRLLDDQREHFQADVEAAKKLLAVGDAKVDQAIDPAEAAAWTNVGSALLNIDATIHR